MANRLSAAPCARDGVRTVRQILRLRQMHGLDAGEHRVIGARHGELPFAVRHLDGSRLEGLLPPVARAPVFAIRKRAGRVIPLNRYVGEGSVTEVEAQESALMTPLLEFNCQLTVATTQIKDARLV